ncbi:MAG: putative quinol monooxygenase [Myxococcota bacterium]|nr:putative quinol monooxygenase [Myxococcota bacterium]
MIIIAGTIDLEASKREAALEESRDLVAETRGQDGCEHYVWAPDLCVPGRIYVYEEWKDEVSLAAHFEGPYYKTMLALIGRFGVDRVDVKKFRIDLVEAVYDPNGVPRADFFTAK